MIPGMAAPAVLDYDRPLSPGTVRITRRSDGVTILVVPDSATRILSAALGPLLILAIFSVVFVLGALARQGIMPVLMLLVFLTVGGVYLLAVVRGGREPIIFRADLHQLKLRNPLDRPKERTIAVTRIATVQLRRGTQPAMPALFQLEVITRREDDESTDSPNLPILLLASPSFETLDKIGRTLVAAMGLREPTASAAEGWWTDHQPPLPATPSSQPPLRSSPDPAC